MSRLRAALSSPSKENGEDSMTAYVIANVKITDDMIPDVGKQQHVMDAAVEAGRLLGTRLAEGHDRGAVTAKMQKVMMEKFRESV